MGARKRGIACVDPLALCGGALSRDPRPHRDDVASASGHRGAVRSKHPERSQRSFSDPAAAVRGGYFRYTNEDEDGAISYANLHWQSGSPKAPSQLWYDVHGKLIGADYSVLQSASPEPPTVWGVNYKRWISFREHIHYMLAGPNGKENYGARASRSFSPPAATSTIHNPKRS